MSLGAGGWRTFWHVTLPNMKWALMYGVILCNARAMGEFGAVAVVSGHVRGLNQHAAVARRDSLQRIRFVAAFAVASLLALLGLVTLRQIGRSSGKCSATTCGRERANHVKPTDHQLFRRAAHPNQRTTAIGLRRAARAANSPTTSLTLGTVRFEQPENGVGSR